MADTKTKDDVSAAASSAVDSATGLSQDVLATVEAGQRAAIEAVRNFVNTVDKAMPSTDEEPHRRKEVVDSALEMADRMVQTQHDFIRKVISTAGKAI